MNDLKERIYKVSLLRFSSVKNYQMFIEMVNDIFNDKVEVDKEIKELLNVIIKQDEEMNKLLLMIDKNLSEQIYNIDFDLDEENINDVIALREVVNDEIFDKYNEYDEIKNIRSSVKNPFINLKTTFIRFSKIFNSLDSKKVFSYNNEKSNEE